MLRACRSVSAISIHGHLTGSPARCAPPTPPVTVWLASFANAPAGATRLVVRACRRRRRCCRRSPSAWVSSFRRRGASPTVVPAIPSDDVPGSPACCRISDRAEREYGRTPTGGGASLTWARMENMGEDLPVIFPEKAEQKAACCRTRGSPWSMFWRRMSRRPSSVVGQSLLRYRTRRHSTAAARGRRRVRTGAAREVSVSPVWR